MKNIFFWIGGLVVGVVLTLTFAVFSISALRFFEGQAVKFFLSEYQGEVHQECLKRGTHEE